MLIYQSQTSLMMSLYWRNRGIPICWYVKKGKKGHFKEAYHVNLIQKAHTIIAPLLPKGMSVNILGEFDGIELQKLSNNYGWSYVFRTACSTVLYENGQAFKAKDIEALSLLEQDCFFISGVEFTKKRFKYVIFLCWHDKKRHKTLFF